MSFIENAVGNVLRVTLQSKSLLTFEKMLAQSSILRDNVFTVMLWAIAITQDGETEISEGPSMFF